MVLAVNNKKDFQSCQRTYIRRHVKWIVISALISVNYKSLRQQKSIKAFINLAVFERNVFKHVYVSCLEKPIFLSETSSKKRLVFKSCKIEVKRMKTMAIKQRDNGCVRREIGAKLTHARRDVRVSILPHFLQSAKQANFRISCHICTSVDYLLMFLI